MQSTPEVPVGLATQAGLAGAITAFVLAVVAFIAGDRSEETIGALVAGAILLYGVVTGRMRQAEARADAVSSSIASSVGWVDTKTVPLDEHAIHDADIEGDEIAAAVNPDDERHDLHDAEGA